MGFFRAYRAEGSRIPAYFIESTAPDNVDDRRVTPTPLPPHLTPIPAQQAIDDIAGELAGADTPNLVVMVHGFNNPEPAVLEMYAGAFAAVHADPAIPAGKGLVFIGYRWPSERMGTPLRGSWKALPTFATWVLYLGVIITVAAHLFFHFYGWSQWGNHLVTLLGWTLAGLVLTAVLLRALVYFRDRYRATNYGVPDLVHIIRVIDGAMMKRREDAGVTAAQHYVDLSFIGHSMGGFVVTNAIRVLSDVFKMRVSALEQFGTAASAEGDASPHIGNVFRLKRFVLASPDIPAESLLDNRANFLAAALKQFREAYLFCSEGDEVLRQISTFTNYFAFPTKSRNHGFRLGNVEILSRNFGMIHVADADFLGALRVGRLTLQQLDDQLEDAAAARHGVARSPETAAPRAKRLPRRFTYFDCTDYVGPDRQGMIRPLLTFAKWDKRHNAAAHLRWHQHLHLLLAYVVRGRPNVHGGYFEGELSQRLMYRLACLGFSGTETAFGSEAEMSAACAAQQIRVLVSPCLAGKPGAAAMPPGVASAAPPLAPLAGPRGFAVPDVERMPIAQARRIIDALRAAYVAGTPTAAPGWRPQLVLLEVTEQSEQPAGTVLRQSPAPGTPLVAGTPIELVVASK